jgi:transposase
VVDSVITYYGQEDFQVLTMEQWVTIKTLKKQNPDLGTRQLARLVGVSRNTVKRALTQDHEPTYVRPCVMNPELEPFTEYIFERLVVKELVGSRVLNEIRSKGYTGSKSAFYRYTATLHPKRKRTSKPYETAPGEQGQFDWSEYVVPIAGVMVKIYVFIYILGYSRLRIYRASFSMTMSSVYEAMEDSLHELGGVPERTQTDNAKCFVTNASRKNFEWNTHYLAFCAHCGFLPSRSLPKHPWSKGKVENPFDYFEDHFIKANSFASFEDFCAKLQEFQTAVNTRVHTTTKETPLARFEREKDALHAVPDVRHVSPFEEVRPVTDDCLISYDGSRYSVPHHFAGHEVWLRISQGCKLLVYSNNNALIATHALSLVKGSVVIVDSHYTNHTIERGSWKRLIVSFLGRFPDEQAFLDKLKAQKRINSRYHLTQILELDSYYSSEQMMAALAACNTYGDFTHSFVRSFLENHYRGAPAFALPEIPSGIISHRTEGSITRPLTEYGKIINPVSSIQS